MLSLFFYHSFWKSNKEFYGTGRSVLRHTLIRKANGTLVKIPQVRTIFNAMSTGCALAAQNDVRAGLWHDLAIADGMVTEAK